MDLFGLQHHDDRHDEVERQIRRLIEQVAALTINQAVTRSELRTLGLTVEGKADQADVDPVLLALNSGLKRARSSLSAATEAAEEGWNEVSDDLSESLAELRTNIEHTPALAPQ